MKIALLIDGSTVTRWQAEAIRQLGQDAQFLIYDCTNSKPGRRRWQHAPYYLLNLISLRSDLTSRVPLPDNIAVVDRIEFECESDGNWQILPKSLIDRIGREQPDMIVKFGMGLLRVPAPSLLPVPILSYHHGDPRCFRGRPAGFYEMFQRKRVVGQVIQLLSNRLDAGKVVAFAETKVHNHSYRLTMREAYAVSPLLLPQAVRAVAEGQLLDIAATGSAYRLPGSLTVARFVARLAWAKVRRLAYGAFAEKAWNVAEAPRPAPRAFPPEPFPPSASWRRMKLPAGYCLLADPFYHPTGDGILVEALGSSSGLGEILNIRDNGEVRRLVGGAGHYSYPATISDPNGNFIIPEISEWSAPRIFAVTGLLAEDAGELKIPGPGRLVDPTPFERDGTVYLFANIASESGAVLRLWLAPSLFDSFSEHPSSPILISPAGARMGGAIIEQGGALYRVGQDGRNNYGDGVILFQIEVLSSTEYREREIGTLRFEDCFGPHTLNLRPDRLLFDFYHNRIDLLAGVRRLRRLLAKRG